MFAKDIEITSISFHLYADTWAQFCDHKDCCHYDNNYQN